MTDARGIDVGRGVLRQYEDSTGVHIPTANVVAVPQDRPSEGWVCPRCKVGVSPKSETCPRCTQKTTSNYPSGNQTVWYPGPPSGDVHNT